MASYITLELNDISAKCLKDVHNISKFKPYAVVSVTGDHTVPKQEIETDVDRSGGSNPTWKLPITFPINESLAKQNRLTLNFKIKSDGFFEEKIVGEVIVPMTELLDSFSSGAAKSMKFISCQVLSSSGRPKGDLHIAYKFAKIVVGTAYSAAMAARSSSAPYSSAQYQPQETANALPQGSVPYSAYPQGQPGYGYHPPQQQGYGYPPPPQPGYGHQPVQNLRGIGIWSGFDISRVCLISLIMVQEVSDMVTLLGWLIMFNYSSQSG